MDMNKAYFSTMKDLFPKAKIVIDLFHVVRYCTWALENVRKRIQKNLPGYQRKYFKRSRRLLLAHMKNLSTEGCNNAIKTLKRLAFGYRNFSNFCNRILLTLNS